MICCPCVLSLAPTFAAPLANAAAVPCALFAGISFWAQIGGYVRIILLGIVFLVFAIILLEIVCKIINYPLRCIALIQVIKALNNVDFIPVPDICDRTPADTNEFPSNPYAPPVEPGMWPVTPSPRYQAAIDWAHEHGFLFTGCFEPSNHVQRSACWLDPWHVTLLTYAINSQGKEEISFTTEFVNENTLVTSDNPEQFILPHPLHFWIQVFPSGKNLKHANELFTEDRPGIDTPSTDPDGTAIMPPGYNTPPNHITTSAAIRVALDRIDSLYTIHKEGIQCLVDNALETLLPPGIGSINKHWLRQDISFLAALQSNDLSDVQKALCRAAKADGQEWLNYVRSLPFWRIRVGWWCSTRPKKMSNISIEEQIARLKH